MTLKPLEMSDPLLFSLIILLLSFLFVYFMLFVSFFASTLSSGFRLTHITKPAGPAAVFNNYILLKAALV